MFADPYPHRALLTAKEVRVMLSLRLTAWKALRRQRGSGFPRPVRLPTGGWRYRKDQVLEWVLNLKPGEEDAAE